MQPPLPPPPPPPSLHQQHGIDAPIQLWVVGDLCVLCPHHLAPRGDQPQVGHIDLNDGALGDDPQLRVHGGGGVLLHGHNVQVEGGFELWVGDVGPLEAQAHGADEALVLWGLAGEALPHERDLGDHALPGLLLPLPRAQHLEHLIVRHGLDLGQGHGPLARLFLALLLDRVGQGLGPGGLLAVQQVRGQGPPGRGLLPVLHLPLLRLVDGLGHGDLLLEPLLIQQLCPDATHGLRQGRGLVGGTGLALPLPLRSIQARPMALLKQLNVLALGLIQGGVKREGVGWVRVSWAEAGGSCFTSTLRVEGERWGKARTMAN